ncbi:sigma 54 modulation/S30EA ribosomal C-terminal domain-containing protein [Kitasatospora sp. NA04385]|uniref:sigma 54 modulation/S30EA ribosomal C-terminal domain-containing protein n=1 Tax=Kitasatospora sp. NA04385 TaxID=2742135 RepID=UPI001590DAFC|nr:sigma 54 modulation/S30EA ribosomal C-terminal domain-containing protein [Kitasatospora sp. NA04385]QKW18199.1 sigma 54 modulation/S30EA ribosomal C-terminal domain-containing protein [Kitasatospora sp. NA04385]
MSVPPLSPSPDSPAPSKDPLALARTGITAAARDASALVEAIRVRLTTGPERVLAQVNAEVDGRRVRVQLAARTAGEAAERLADGLRQRVRTVSANWRPRPWPGAAPTPPVSFSTRIVRVKSPSLVWCSPDAAIRTLDAMDYDIHLFTDPATETDAVVHRIGPTGYRLTRTLPAAPPRHPAAPLTLGPHPAPPLTDREAADRLTAADLPYLFYADPRTHRGRVLYRRLDGHLALLAPATAPA